MLVFLSVFDLEGQCPQHEWPVTLRKAPVRTGLQETVWTSFVLLGGLGRAGLAGLPGLDPPLF